MDFQSRSSDNFLSTTSSNFWDYMTKPGELDFRLLPSFWLTSRPHSGKFQIIPIRNGKDGSTMQISFKKLSGVLPSMSVLLTGCGVLSVHTPLHDVSATTSFVAGVINVCGANIIGTIYWSNLGIVCGGKTGMF